MEDDDYHQPELNDLVPPKNHGPLPPFHSLVEAIFSPLVDDINRLSKQQGRAPQAIKRDAISQFIERWRTRVGSDIFPAFRLRMFTFLIAFADCVFFNRACLVLPDVG